MLGFTEENRATFNNDTEVNTLMYNTVENLKRCFFSSVTRDLVNMACLN